MKKILSCILSLMIMISTIPIMPTEVQAETQKILTWTDGNVETSVGAGGSRYTAAIRFTPEELATYNSETLKKVSFRLGDGQTLTSYIVKVWIGGNANDPGTLVVEQAGSNAVEGWNEVTLDTPITIDATKEIWIGIDCVEASGWPIAVSNESNIKGKSDLVYLDSWMNLTDNGFNYCWCIRGILEDEETPFEYNSVYVVGNGQGNWLNGIEFDTSASVNKMTKTADDIWEIDFSNVDASDDYNFKFVIDGSWTVNFGVRSDFGSKVKSGMEYEAVYNGERNIPVTIKNNNSDVHIKLDLSNYNNGGRTGAKFTVTISPDEPEGEPYNIWVAGTQVTSLNANDLSVIDGVDGKVSFDASSNTLTLENASIINKSPKNTNAILDFGIYTNLVLKVVAKGTNVVKAKNDVRETAGIAAEGISIELVNGASLNAEGGNRLRGSSEDLSSGRSCGVQAHYGTITIKGSGTLKAVGGNMDSNEYGSISIGLAYGNYECLIDGNVKVYATGGNVEYGWSYGAQVDQFEIRKGSFVATGGVAAQGGNGLYASSISIKGGTVEAKTNTNDSYSSALNCIPTLATGCNAIASTNTDGSNAVTYNADSNSTYKYFYAHIHSLTKVPAKPATTSAAGNKEYYKCDCGKFYEDAEGKKEIKDKNSVIIPKIEEPVLTPEEAAMPTVEKTAEIIKKTNTDKKDVEGSDYQRLMLKATSKKNTITLKWKQIKGADGYIIYGAPCGQKMTQLLEIKNPKTVKYVFKKLKKGKYYKYMVVAYKKTAAGNRVITKSKSAHCATPGGKKGNPTGLKIKKSKITLKKGKKTKIKATMTKKQKVATHIAKFRYESSNTKVATVDKKGQIKAKAKGKATIFVYLQNGICKKVKVKVK